jgi:hypothetical protein
VCQVAHFWRVIVSVVCIWLPKILATAKIFDKLAILRLANIFGGVGYICLVFLLIS